MQYKTIVLEMLHDQPYLYEELRSSKRLLTAMESYAQELKAIHEACKKQLVQSSPQADYRLIESEALELAIQALLERLPCASLKAAAAPISLDAAMNQLRAHTPPA